MSRWLRVRWALDRVVALVLLLPAAPLIGLLALLIRRDDRGPGLVRLTRVGQGGRRFAMLKLRTMRADAPSGRAGGDVITSGDDERVTNLGRRLRRRRLDELPQLVNVVRGEMALVGPRPETPEYVDPSDDRWAQVLRARPGIAGLTQLIVHEWESEKLARSAASYGTVVLAPKLDLDRWYLEHASPRLDALIIGGLLGVVGLGGRNERLRRRVPPALLAPLEG